MLGGLEAYGSDESDPDSPVHIEDSSTAREKTITSESLLSLPPPVNSAKARPKRAIFTVTKPTKNLGLDKDEENEEAKRVTKKLKLGPKTSAGSSSLLAMLPAPTKTTLPVTSKASKGNLLATTDVEERHAEESAESHSKTLLIPVQSLKNTPNHKSHQSKPSVDFFSLGSTNGNTPAKNLSTTTTSASPPVPASVSSAPSVPTFEPPDPTPEDPYPGYYQLPSGQWAAYEQEYYMKFYSAWVAESQRPEKGFEGAESGDTVQIDAQTQLDLARKEREDRKALTRNAGGGPSAPKMNIKAAKAGSLAKTRHQLSTLLTEAYENREALEERIAQAKRNRKESGNKYGF